MSYFTKAIRVLLKHEGGFAPEDNGRGAVNFGITQKTYDAAGYPDKPGWPRRVSLLNVAHAEKFYEDEFWTPMKCGAIADQKLAEMYFSLGVNCGQVRALRWLQEAACDELRIDGVFGPKTTAAVNRRNPAMVIGNLKDLAWEHYQYLARKNPERYADDLRGWIKRLSELSGDASLAKR